jgi:hypothetical protein
MEVADKQLFNDSSGKGKSKGKVVSMHVVMACRGEWRYSSTDS